MSTFEDGIMSLADLVEAAASKRSTLRIRVRAGAAAGAIFIDDGVVVHAELGPLVGDDAVATALGARTLRFTADPGVTSEQRTVLASVAELLAAAEPGGAEAPAAVVPARASVLSMAAPRRAGVQSIVLLVGGIAAIVAASLALWLSLRGEAAAVAPPGASSPAGRVDPAITAVEGATLVGPGDLAPVRLAGAAPARPAVDLALTPTVVCRLLVDAQGAVRSASVYRSRLELAVFEAAALDAVVGWRFEPARRGGVPVAAWINWPVSFAADLELAPIRIKGSDTIGGALGPALAAAFRAQRPDVQVTVEALGSATAFGGLLDGSADLGASSRPVKPGELADASRLGVRLEEFVLGYDGLAIVVHPDNRLSALTLEQVARLFRGEITRWSELGGADRPVNLVTRPAYSGTYDFFVEHVVKLGDRGSAATLAATARVIEHSDAVVAAVAADADAVGFTGLGWVDARVRALAIAAGEDRPAIAPSAATVRDGSYPVYRPLLLYTRQGPRGALAELLRFALSAPGQALVAEHGFVPGDTPDALVAAIGAGADDPDRAATGTLAARLEFAPGSAAPSRAQRPALDALVARARAAPVRLLIIGHADAEGGSRSARNRSLAARRAAAVAAWLERAGVERSRVTVEAAGAAQPLGTNTTQAGRDRNRRVDVYVVPDA